MEFANRNRNTLYLEMSCATERRGDWTHDIDLDGVERIVKGMMMLLFALMIVLAVNSLLLPDAMKGLSFYLRNV